MTTVWRGERGSITTLGEGPLFRVNGCTGGEALKETVIEHSKYPQAIKDYVVRTLDVLQDKIRAFFEQEGFLFADGRSGTLVNLPNTIEKELEKQKLIIATVDQYKYIYGLDFRKWVPCTGQNFISIAGRNIREGLEYSLGINNALYIQFRVGEKALIGFSQVGKGFATKIDHMWDRMPGSVRRPFSPSAVMGQQLFDLSLRGKTS